MPPSTGFSPAEPRRSRPTTTPIPDLIADLPEGLRGLATRGVPRRYRKGALLIQEDEDGDALYIILAGQLRAFSVNEQSKEITYGNYGPGEYVGEMSLDGGRRSANVEAVQASVCLMVTRQTLTQHIGEHPEFAFELITKLIRRARAATQSAKQLALNDVYGRLKFQLESAAVLQPDGTRVIEQKLTQQALAHRIGCVREMVSKVMKELRAGGYVSVGKDRITLLTALPPRW